MKSELLPCPFCGGQAHVNTARTTDKDFIKLNGRDSGFGVNCVICGTNNRGMACGWATQDAAIKHWNTRAPILRETPAEFVMVPVMHAATPAEDADLGAVRVLADHAAGRINHANNGLCPDEVEGHDTRDPECPVCRALIDSKAVSHD